MKKKALLFITSVFMLIFCAFSVNAQESRNYEESEWLKIADGVVYCINSYNDYYYVRDYFATDELAKTATEINIVNEIDGKPVKRIAVDYDHMFRESYPQVEKINIPEGIEYIGEGAFTAFDSMKTVKLPKSVTYVGAGAFATMEALEKITLPEGVTYISDLMFYKCTKLQSVNFEGKIQGIGNSAFSGCKSIISFDIPDTVTSLGEEAFRGSGITYIYIPAKVKLGFDEEFYGYFRECKSLKKVEFENRYTKYFTVEAYTFKDCTALEEVILPEAQNIRVSTEAFRNCEKLKVLTGTDRIYWIGSSAFYNCGMEEITLRGDVDFDDYSTDEKGRVVASVFESCKNLRNVIFTNEGEIKKFVVHYKMFKNCDALERVILPSEAKEIIIEERAFIYCDSLIGVYNSAKVTEIGKLAFYGCKTLKTFTVPEKIKIIKQRTFYGCEKLKNVYLHDGITKIEKNAFSKCPKLTAIHYEGTKTQYGKIKKTADLKNLSAKVNYNADYQALPENVRASVRADKVVLSWKKDKSADGYRIYILNGGKLKKVADTKKTKYTYKNLENGKDYTFFIRCYSVNKSGKKVLDPQKESVIITAGVNEISNLAHSQVKMKRLTLSWDKAEGATGYRVYLMKDGKWEKIADTKALTYTVTGLKSGTDYVFGVRAKEKVGGKTYWSDIEFIGVKTRPAKVKALKAEKVGKNDVTLTWDRVEGADGYSVYRKTAKGEWKLIREYTTKDSYTVKKLSPGTEYNFAVRSYTGLDKGNAVIRNYTAEYSVITVATKK